MTKKEQSSVIRSHLSMLNSHNPFSTDYYNQVILSRQGSTRSTDILEPLASSYRGLHRNRRQHPSIRQSSSEKVAVDVSDQEKEIKETLTTKSSPSQSSKSPKSQITEITPPLPLPSTSSTPTPIPTPTLTPTSKTKITTPIKIQSKTSPTSTTASNIRDRDRDMKRKTRKFNQETNQEKEELPMPQVNVDLEAALSSKQNKSRQTPLGRIPRWSLARGRTVQSRRTADISRSEEDTQPEANMNLFVHQNISYLVEEALRVQQEIEDVDTLLHALPTLNPILHREFPIFVEYLQNNNIDIEDEQKIQEQIDNSEFDNSVAQAYRVELRRSKLQQSRSSYIQSQLDVLDIRYTRHDVIQCCKAVQRFVQGIDAPAIPQITNPEILQEYLDTTTHETSESVIENEQVTQQLDIHEYTNFSRDEPQQNHFLLTRKGQQMLIRALGYVGTPLCYRILGSQLSVLDAIFDINDKNDMVQIGNKIIGNGYNYGPKLGDTQHKQLHSCPISVQLRSVYQIRTTSQKAIMNMNIDCITILRNNLWCGVLNACYIRGHQLQTESAQCNDEINYLSTQLHKLQKQLQEQQQMGSQLVTPAKQYLSKMLDEPQQRNIVEQEYRRELEELTLLSPQDYEIILQEKIVERVKQSQEYMKKVIERSKEIHKSITECMYDIQLHEDALLKQQFLQQQYTIQFQVLDVLFYRFWWNLLRKGQNNNTVVNTINNIPNLLDITNNDKNQKNLIDGTNYKSSYLGERLFRSQRRESHSQVWCNYWMHLPTQIYKDNTNTTNNNTQCCNPCNIEYNIKMIKQQNRCLQPDIPIPEKAIIELQQEELWIPIKQQWYWRASLQLINTKLDLQNKIPIPELDILRNRQQLDTPYCTCKLENNNMLYTNFRETMICIQSHRHHDLSLEEREKQIQEQLCKEQKENGVQEQLRKCVGCCSISKYITNQSSTTVESIWSQQSLMLQYLVQRQPQWDDVQDEEPKQLEFQQQDQYNQVCVEYNVTILRILQRVDICIWPTQYSVQNDNNGAIRRDQQEYVTQEVVYSQLPDVQINLWLVFFGKDGWSIQLHNLSIGLVDIFLQCIGYTSVPQYQQPQQEQQQQEEYNEQQKKDQNDKYDCTNTIIKHPTETQVYSQKQPKKETFKLKSTDEQYHHGPENDIQSRNVSKKQNSNGITRTENTRNSVSQNRTLRQRGNSAQCRGNRSVQR